MCDMRINIGYVNGLPCVLQDVAADKEFWLRWRADKDALIRQGYFVRKVADKWQVRRAVPLRDARGLLSEAVAESYATDTNFEVPIPVGARRLFPFQRAGVAYAYSRSHTLLADPMGLGKTVQAVGLCNVIEPDARILVICPASLRLNWKREFERWDVFGRQVHVPASSIPPLREGSVLVINYDRLKTFASALDEMRFNLVILDEAHYLKNPDAQRTRFVFGSGKKQAPIIHADRWLSLSGTPMTNRPNELWTHVSAYDPNGLGSSWFNFHTRFCAAAQRRIGSKTVWDVSGASNLDELNLALRAKFLIRREKEVVLSQLPSKRRQIIPLEPVSVAEARYVAIEREVIQSLLARNLDVEQALRSPSMFPELTAIAKIRQELALKKSHLVAQFALDILEQEEKLVVFCWHRSVAEETARLINEALDGSAVVVHGEMDADARAAIVQKFQNSDSPRVLVATMLSLGVGHTLTRASTVLFAELSWTPADVWQAEDRIHRIGQERDCLSVIPVYNDSLEAYIAETMLRKEDDFEAVMR